MCAMPIARADRWQSVVPRVLLLALIHAILLLNAIRHDPRVAYDAEEHLEYIAILSELKLPKPEQTYEFFSPPLPYVVPAAARRFLDLDVVSAARAGMLFNVLVSLFLMHHLARIADLLRPGHEGLKLLAIGLLGSLPVYYRTFAFVRGEPLLAAMAVAAAHEAIAIVVKGDRSWRRAARLGVWLGLALISRQMAFLLLPALGLLAAARVVASPRVTRALAARLAAAAGLCVLLSGPFYAHLAVEYGGVGAYARKGSSFSLSNNPASFYFDPGLKKLFADPVRDAFPNRLIPLFHSETWGDYWCYFLVYGFDGRSGKPMSGLAVNRALNQTPRPEWLRTNRESIAPYLGRVNAAALPASAAMVCGFALGLASLGRVLAGRGGDETILTRSFLFLIAACTLAGFFWFLTVYPSPEVGRSIKATYVLQLFPFLCLMAADAIVRLGIRSGAAARWSCALLVACALHNAPALFTRTVVH